MRIDSLSDRISFATTLEPIYEAVIEPRVAGFLTSIRFDGGAPVRRGEVIFTIEQSEYSALSLASRAELEESQAQLALAKSNYERAVPLSRIDAISRMNLEEYESNYRAARASVEYAEQQLKNSDLNLGYTIIRAPLSGIIANTPARQGDYVGPATEYTTLTTISNLDTMILSLVIPASRYLRYNRSESYNNRDLLSDIIITLPDGSIYPHEVSYYYTEQSAGEGSSSYTIVVCTPNPERSLKGGMFARVNAAIGGRKGRVVIPQRAVSQVQGINSVWVVGADSVVSPRTVTLGSTYGAMWEISSGLQLGERVLVSGQMKVHSGAKVAPTEVREGAQNER